MFRSDRGDTEELYRSFLPEIKAFHTIDEIDFSGNIHGMKYHFIQTLKNPLADMFDEGKTKDFAYWGRMKHGNDREKTIRKIYRSDLSTVMVGGFPSGVQRQSAWIKDWKELYPLLEPARSTLCFNWIDPHATTSRYPEALSIGMIPFVWKDYDKIIELRDETVFTDKLEEYRNNYKKVLLSEKEYYKQFTERMNNGLIHDSR